MFVEWKEYYLGQVSQDQTALKRTLHTSSPMNCELHYEQESWNISWEKMGWTSHREARDQAGFIHTCRTGTNTDEKKIA